MCFFVVVVDDNVFILVDPRNPLLQFGKNCASDRQNIDDGFNVVVVHVLVGDPRSLGQYC